MQNNPFFIPNEGRNFKVKELPYGVNCQYTLSCSKDFPKKTFVSKSNKAYYITSIEIRYTDNMSNHIYRAYKKLKYDMMLELALYKRKELNDKITSIQEIQLNLF